MWHVALIRFPLATPSGWKDLVPMVALIDRRRVDGVVVAINFTFQ